MRVVFFVVIAVAATLAYSHLRPSDSARAGGKVIAATKKVQVIGTREGKRALNVAREAIHDATAQDGGAR